MMILLQYLFSSRNVLITLPLCIGLDLAYSQSSLPQRQAVVDNVVNQCCADLICQIRSSLSTFLVSFLLPLPFLFLFLSPLPPAWPPSLPLPLLIPLPPFLLLLVLLSFLSPRSPPRLTLSLTLSIVLEDR